MLYSDEMTERAVKAYLRWHKRTTGLDGPMPSSSESQRKGNIVTLVNVNGPLARYRVRRNRLVRMG